MARKLRMDIIPAGAVFTASHAEHGEVCLGVYMARRAIDPVIERDVYLAAHPKQAEPYKFRDHDFLRWLEEVRGCAAKMPRWDWVLSSYSSVAEMECLKGED